MFKERSKVLFVAALLATIYVIYLICYFGGSMISSDSAEVVGGMIATAVVTPHMVRQRKTERNHRVILDRRQCENFIFHTAGFWNAVTEPAAEEGMNDSYVRV